MLTALQTGGNPNQAIYGLSDGACGFGEIPRTSWPFWQVAALGFTNPISGSNMPQKWGCGACLEVTCEGPVRLSCLRMARTVSHDHSRRSQCCIGISQSKSDEEAVPGTPHHQQE